MENALADKLWETFPLEYTQEFPQLPGKFNQQETYILFDPNTNERTLGRFISFENNQDGNFITFIDIVHGQFVGFPLGSIRIFRLSDITNKIHKDSGLNNGVQNNIASYLAGGKKSRKHRKSRKSRKHRKSRK